MASVERRSMFLIPIYASFTDHRLCLGVIGFYGAFMRASLIFSALHDCHLLMAGHQHQTLVQFYASTKVAPNPVSTLLPPLYFVVWVLWWRWRWLKVWGYWDTLVWEGKVGGKALMRITSGGEPPIESSAFFNAAAASTTLLIFGRLDFAFSALRGLWKLTIVQYLFFHRQWMLSDDATGWQILIRKYQV